MSAQERKAAIVFGVLVWAAVLSLTVVSSAQQPPPSTPFAFKVRPELFAGLRGDLRRLDVGMKICEETLAENPDHAEALVWHGMGLTIRASRHPDLHQREALLRAGLAEMDRAVALARSQLGERETAVIIPRSSTLNSLVRLLPPELGDFGRELLQKAATGFEQSLLIQAPYFSRMSVHRRGELLGALVESWSGLGETQKAQRYLTWMVKEMEGTEYGARARVWLTGASDRPRLTCVSCHDDY